MPTTQPAETLVISHAPAPSVDEAVLDHFRRWGFLEARLDPLSRLVPQRVPELREEGAASETARRWYCGSIGAEFMHLPDRAKREWIQEQMERDEPRGDSARILDRIVSAKAFEQVLHSRYPGTKRFSLEGMTSLIPLLDEILDEAARDGAAEVVLGMSHRGRLNVMLHIVGRKAEEIFAGFEDVDPRSTLGGGDVKYHIGATGTYITSGGRSLEIHLVSNPSHLEAVDPVVLGRARAKQLRDGRARTEAILPLIIHGDAAFAGQGIAAEALNMADLAGYTVGGSIHIIANNLIGFTGIPAELHTSRFASDLAHRQPVPVFHVNAEDPDAVVRVGRIAAAYRKRFAGDVVIDLIGFRLHGHSEIDDPSITQPLLYDAIHRHPSLYQSYAESLGIDAGPRMEELRAKFSAAQETGARMETKPALYELPSYWSPFTDTRYDPAAVIDTRVPREVLRELAAQLASVPAGFRVHPKVRRLLEQRLHMGEGASPLDYGTAEALAFGSLLLEGVPVRLSGQDSRRGTFNQRHAVLIDTATEQEHIPLAGLNGARAPFEVYNSPLSEASVLAFEYGYSRDYPEALVLWEAQFGDFANGAQVIIDQFIAAGEDKWGLPSGVVLLLPHGYEGQGPEHSSARMERFLQLAAENNMEICQPTTAAQYFHLLRRQALRRWRKPLVIFTPKSMLRHPQASSPLADLSEGGFREVMDDEGISNAGRVIVCTGKVAHELQRARQEAGATSTAIVRLEQLYPFPAEQLASILEKHSSARDIVWVQEEPANMGGLCFILPRLEEVSGGRPVRSVKRSASASPATGSGKAHEMEQKTLLAFAFSSIPQ